MTSPTVPPDIVPDRHDIALGGGWFPPEQYRGQTFRWVENDAVLHIAALKPVHHALRLVVEPGPGVGLETFELQLSSADGREIARVPVASKQTVRVPLPPERPRVLSVVLHAAGGGQPSPNDPRVLNFRVFEVNVEHTADVFPAWATPESGFYALESSAGDHFRWVGGDATVRVHARHEDTLVFDAESGPGFESKPFALRALGRGGDVLAAVEVASRTTVRVPLAGAAEGLIVLRADGGGRALHGDPRTLNYRVFAAAGAR